MRQFYTRERKKEEEEEEEGEREEEREREKGLYPDAFQYSALGLYTGIEE